ncbi:MAG: tRNA (adenosine(37)-N6)-threonylcarbamoyltransferase complex ATPase subunit type 1 TsaE [Verrucomicrobiota bacterium]
MFISQNVAETVAYGGRCAQSLHAGDVLALGGDLGTGKTQFVKGVVAGLGSDDEATSPTFTLIHEYTSGRLPVYHFDFYRLTHGDELRQLGLEDYFNGEGVCVIEWADRFPEILPARAEWFWFETRSESERAIFLGDER